MVSVSDIVHLSRLTGKELVVEAARIAVKNSMIVMHPMLEIETQDHQALSSLSQGWAESQHVASEYNQIMERSTQRVLDDWEGDAAEGFNTYMGSFFTVTEAQYREINDIIASLDAMDAALKDAEDGLQDGISQAELAIGIAVVTCIVEIAIGGLAGVAAALVTAGLGILAALGAFIRQIYVAIGRKATALTAASQKIKISYDEASGAMPALSAVQLPPEPAITGPQLGSILKNLDNQFYRDH